MMAARDIYHNTVKKALEKDGWIITNDPLNILPLTMLLSTKFFQRKEVGELLLETTELRLMIFNSETEEIVKWIS